MSAIDQQNAWHRAAATARQSIHGNTPIRIAVGSSESVGSFLCEDKTEIVVYQPTQSYRLAQFMHEHCVMPSTLVRALELPLTEVFAMLRGKLAFDFSLVEAALREHRILLAGELAATSKEEPS